MPPVIYHSRSSRLGHIEGTPAWESALTGENYWMEFLQVNARFTEKPQVSTPSLPFAARVAGLLSPAA
ncbi:hypothetical protein GCM10010385_42310 [Streptomyces geysiriensis]|nr:hypothetical protein GCM10010385_42310 [Streptomyces geysiriensis]